MNLRVPSWLIGVAFPLVWVAVHRAAVVMDVGPGVSIWYPPAGLTLALLLLRPRLAPVAYVGIGYVVATGAYVPDPFHAVLSWLIPPTGYALGAWAIRRVPVGAVGMGSVRAVAVLLVGALATAAAVAVANVANFCAAGVMEWGAFSHFVLRFLIGDAVGITALVPMILVVARRSSAPARAARVWAARLGVPTAMAVLLGLEANEVLLGPEQRGLSYFLALPVVWSALAFGMVGAALASCWANLGIVAVSWWLGAASVGAGTPYYMLSLSCLGLLVGAVVEERQRAQQQLRRDQAALDRAAQRFTTSETAAKVVHELRHPLACLHAYVEGMRGMATAPTVSGGELAEVAERAAVELGRANAILENLQRAAERSARPGRPLSLARLLDDLAPLLRQTCLDHGVRLRLSTVEAWVRGEAAALQQVLLNLVRNAAEALDGHRAGGLVTVALSAQPGHAVLEVADDGPGFPPAILERGHALFASDKVDGQGLGLLIVRRLVDLQGGDVALHNLPGGGAGVRVRLPMLPEGECHGA